MRKIILFIVLTVFYSCGKQINLEEIFKNSYDSDIDNCQLEIDFKIKKDTVFFSYFYAMNNGLYLNSPDDINNDYAGYFLKKDIQDNKVSFKIKNFRYSSDADKEIYNKIKLHFISNDEIVWSTDLTKEKNNFIPYLPNTVKLRKTKQANANL